MHLLKILNTIFCTAQVLPSCVKSCFRPQHNYSDIDVIVLSIRKKIDWFLHGISLDDFDKNVMFFFSVRPIIYFLLQPFLLTSIPLCMFCLIATCDMHCKQHKPSTWALLALRPNVVINIAKKTKNKTITFQHLRYHGRWIFMENAKNLLSLFKLRRLRKIICKKNGGKSFLLFMIKRKTILEYHFKTSDARWHL